MSTGWRVAEGKADLRRDLHSQFAALYAPPGDRTTVMGINHSSLVRLAPRLEELTEPAWLWLRHGDARSKGSKATNQERDNMVPFDAALRARFPVDWSYLETL